jgi:hypothetical protein
MNISRQLQQYYIGFQFLGLKITYPIKNKESAETFFKRFSRVNGFIHVEQKHSKWLFV